MSVEKWLDGSWTKFNGNNGYVNKAQSAVAGAKLDFTPDFMHGFVLEAQIPHAFTHWSHEHTLAQHGEEHAAMICDIQGVGLDYTDLTVCTQDRRFGPTGQTKPLATQLAASHTRSSPVHAKPVR